MSPNSAGHLDGKCKDTDLQCCCVCPEKTPVRAPRRDTGKSLFGCIVCGWVDGSKYLSVNLWFYNA